MWNNKLNIGNQYTLDDEFKKLARLHQSIYRASILNVEFDEYGNRLREEDARKLLNYYDRLNSRTVLRNRYPHYSKTRDADMLRSEHIPFNIIAPLDTNKELAITIIKDAFGIELSNICKIEMEFAPEPKYEYLNDGTSFDAYIEGCSWNNEIIGIGIEIKYTEKSYQIGKIEQANVTNHNSHYWTIARDSSVFIEPDNETFGSDELRQIWRNHLLGLAMRLRGKVIKFYSVTLFPSGNTHFVREIPRYKSFLKKDCDNVIGCTFEKFIDSIAGSEDFMHWKHWLWKRYIIDNDRTGALLSSK